MFQYFRCFGWIVSAFAEEGGTDCFNTSDVSVEWGFLMCFRKD